MQTPHARAGTAEPVPDTAKGYKTSTPVNCSSHVIQQNGVRLRSTEDYLSS